MSWFLNALKNTGESAMSSGVSGLFSSLFGGGSTKRAQNRAFAQNKKMAEILQGYERENAETAYNRQVDFWNLQNAYNSPENQRQLLEDAGFNPALMYGGMAGVSQAGQLSPIQKASSPSASMSGNGLPVNVDPEALSRIEVNKAQARKLDQEAETEPFKRALIDSQTSLTSLQGEGQDISNQLSQINLYIEGKTADVKVETVIANLDSVLSTVARTNAETDVAKATKEVRIAEAGATYALTALRMAQTDLANADVKVSKAQAQLFLSEVKRNLIENIRDVQLIKESQAKEQYIDRKRTNETVTTYVNLYDRVILGTADKVLGALGHVVKKALSQSTVELNKQLTKRAAKVGTEHYDGEGILRGVDLDVW